MLPINDTNAKKQICLETIHLLTNILDINLDNTQNKCLSSSIKTVAYVLELLFENPTFLDTQHEQFYSLINTINIVGFKLNIAVLNNTLTFDKKEYNTGVKSNEDNIKSTAVYSSANLNTTNKLNVKDIKDDIKISKNKIYDNNNISKQNKINNITSNVVYSHPNLKTTNKSNIKDIKNTLNNNFINCKSFTDKDKTYIIDTDSKTCSCPAFHYMPTKMCKHLKNANILS